MINMQCQKKPSWCRPISNATFWDRLPPIEPGWIKNCSPSVSGDLNPIKVLKKSGKYVRDPDGIGYTTN